MAKISSVTIKQGTTPIIAVTLDGESIQDATVYLSLKIRDRLIVKSNYHDTGEITVEPIYNELIEQIGTSITAQLSQIETLCLHPGTARIEVGWVFEDGSADKSNIGVINISASLLNGVMRYGEHTS
jgi:hypothetical protein